MPDVRWWPKWAGRRGPVLAEVSALAVLVVLDSVLLVRGRPATGPLAVLAQQFAPGFGPVAAVLAVLRRRFPGHIPALAGGVLGLSALGTLLSALSLAAGQGLSPQPGSTETLACVLLVGAACHRLPPRSAAAFAVAGGLAVTLAPILRFGPDSPATLLAALAALSWGAALAAGLMLRDADARRRATVAEVRTGERLRLARELHDLVAHHITGIVVRVQAAHRIAERQGGETATLKQIEEAGTEALAAMRRLVGMLRTDGSDLFRPPDGILAAIDQAVPGDGGVVLRIPGGLAHADAAPEVVTTAHRLLTEALTNVRRHAPNATEVTVTAEVDGPWLVLEVDNDAADRPGTGGYGLIGMAERVAAVGGTVRVGPEQGQRWRVSARLPLRPETG
ncbi:signal transduction histidine kinase [Amycolatopsis bartoniae]|nr:histidine kinase [Amycolatopsis bartoniae]MBB2938962.1 signal transduction histidine kinase [Amycolatopsis bartoniae]TVT11235.1 histidine kinase [Amycolatopsis bartoniae]